MPAYATRFRHFASFMPLFYDTFFDADADLPPPSYHDSLRPPSFDFFTRHFAAVILLLLRHESISLSPLMPFRHAIFASLRCRSRRYR